MYITYFVYFFPLAPAANNGWWMYILLLAVCA